MSIIDGGSFKCYAHDTIFETTNPREWEEHRKTDGTDSGSAPCAICGNITEYSHKPVGKKPLCATCKEDLLK